MGRVKEERIGTEEYAASHGVLPMERGLKYVCSKHLYDNYAKQYVEDSGTKGKCSYCGRHGKVVDMADLTEWIAGKVLKYYCNPDNDDLYLASSFYEDENEIIHGFKKVGPYITSSDAETYESTEYLLSAHDLSREDRIIQDIASNFKNDNWINRDSCIIKKGKELSMSWNTFVSMLKHQRRYTFFFSPNFVRDMEHPTDNGLDDILTEINSIIAQNGLIEPLPAGTTLYRCRKVISQDEVKDFDDITAAPDNYAAQSRMSPAGISMFYAAFDVKVAQAEAVADDKKSFVATGIFKTKKELHVVNLVDLPNANIWSGHDYESMLFIHKFSHEISQPVDNNAIHYDYVPTQVFTEYLRYMMNTSDGKSIDGIIYKSCKCPNVCNIVLFCNQEESKEFVEIKEISYK